MSLSEANELVTDDMGPIPWVSNIVPVLKGKDVRKRMKSDES